MLKTKYNILIKSKNKNQKEDDMGDLEVNILDKYRRVSYEELVRNNDEAIYLIYSEATNRTIYRVTSITIEGIELTAIIYGNVRFVTEAKVGRFLYINDISLVDLKKVLSGAEMDFYNRYIREQDTLAPWEDKVNTSSEYITTQIGKNMNTKLQNVTDANVIAAKVAVQITTGNMLNKALIAKIRPQLPMMVRGYSDHALMEVIVANIANFSVQNFAENNAKAKWATEAMMIASMSTLMQSFNIDEVLSEFLEGVVIPEGVN